MWIGFSVIVWSKYFHLHRPPDFVSEYFMLLPQNDASTSYDRWPGPCPWFSLSQGLILHMKSLCKRIQSPWEAARRFVKPNHLSVAATKQNHRECNNRVNEMAIIEPIVIFIVAKPMRQSPWWVTIIDWPLDKIRMSLIA